MNLCEDFQELMFTDERNTIQLSITSLGQKGNWAETVMYKAVRDMLMFSFVFIFRKDLQLKMHQQVALIVTDSGGFE